MMDTQSIFEDMGALKQWLESNFPWLKWKEDTFGHTPSWSVKTKKAEISVCQGVFFNSTERYIGLSWESANEGRSSPLTNPEEVLEMIRYFLNKSGFPQRPKEEQLTLF